MLKTILKYLWLIIFETLEWICRIIYLMLPLGFHIFAMQMREKVNVVSTLETFVSPESRWAMIYDGVVLVNSNPGAVRARIRSFNAWLKRRIPFFITVAVILIIALLVNISIKIGR